MKIIRGTRDHKGNVFQKTPAGGVGRHRCMKCQQLCTAQRLPDGKLVMKCGGCGASYTATSMDGPKAPRPGALPTRAPR
jgi:hypothetical protein